MKQNFGHRPKPDLEPAELTAGGLYLVFAILIVVLWLIFTHP